MKHALPLLAVAAAAALPLAVSGKVINNFFDQNGFPLIVPTVRKLEKAPGAFALPQKIAVAAPQDAEKLVALLNEKIRGRFGKWSLHPAAEGEKAAIRLVLAQDDLPASPEGYTLAVGTDGIEIRARELRGLFYGCHTLAALITNNTTVYVPKCRITDWPEFPVRGIFLNLRDLKSSEVPQFVKVIRMLASLKLNTLVLEFAENLPLKDSPFTARKTPTLTEKDIAAILAAARDNYMEIVPHLQTITHERWLRTHPEYREKITSRKKDPGGWNSTWNTTICPEKPLARELTDYTIRETVRILKPKAFHLGLDEFHLCRWQVCDFCKTPHTTKQMVDEIHHVVKFTRSLGVTPWVYHDALRPGHPEKGEEALPGMPKDTVINMWSYRERPTVEFFEFFRKQGFEDQVGVSFCNVLANTMTMPRAAKEYRAKGVVLTYWHFVGRGMLKLEEFSPHAAAGTALSADYSWNPDDRDFTTLTWDPAREVRRRLAPLGERRFGLRYMEIPLNGVYNTLIGKDDAFPLLTAAAANKAAAAIAAQTPEKFRIKLAPSGEIAAAILSGSPKDNYPAGPLTVDTDGIKARGFSVLMTATRPADPSEFGYQKPRHLPVLLTATFRYADGSSAKRNFAYRQHYTDWNSEASGISGRFVWRSNDKRGALYNFCALDIDNPSPAKAVKAIEFSSARKFGVAPALLAMVAYAPEKGTPAITSEKPLPTAAVEAPREPEAKLVIAADFENGMGGARFRTEGSFAEKPTTRIIDEMDAPVPGKVLEITLPPAVGKLSNGRWAARAILDVPVGDFEEINSVFANYKVSDPAAVDHSAIYLMDAKIRNLETKFGFHTAGDNQWRMLTVPRRLLQPNINDAAHNKRLPNDQIKVIRFSLWFKPYDKPIKLWIGRIGTSPSEGSWQEPLCNRQAE